MIFRFAHPELLWLLLLLPLVALLIGRLGKRGALRYSSTTLLGKLAGKVRSRAGMLMLGLRFLAVALAIVALARPQFGKEEESIETNAIDIVLVVDVSGSMWAHDFEVKGQAVDRLTAVKTVVEGFVDRRKSDRLGLVVFASDPYLVSPLTLNHTWLKENMDRLYIGIVDQNRTAIGSALGMAVNRLRTQTAKSKIVILLTDGENNAGSIGPLAAAEAASALGIKVYTIGAGREGIVPMPQMDRNGQLLRDRNGQIYFTRTESKVDFETLQKVAETTGGKAYRATDTKLLESIYEEIDQLEKTEIKLNVTTLYRDVFHWPLSVALGFLGLELLLKHTRFRRLP